MAEVIKIQKKQHLIKRINGLLISYFKLSVVILFLLILLLGYFLVIMPKYNRISKEFNDAEDAQLSKQKNIEQYLGQLDQLNQTYNNISTDDLKKIEILLPSAPQTEQLMAEMQKIADDNGLIMPSLAVVPDDKNYLLKPPTLTSTATDVTKMSLGKVEISMNLLGLDYKGLKNLLSILEKNLRLMDINRLSWSPDSDSVSLDITTYYLKQ